MITLELDEDDVLELLENRLRFWTSDKEYINLFMKYYKDLILSGYFEGIRLDLKVLVDNDYLNNYSIDYLSNYKDSIYYNEDAIICYDEGSDLCLLIN